MTNIKAEAAVRRAANFGFVALTFALYGWINLEVLMLRNNPGIPAQLFTCLLGGYLSISAYRRYHISWGRMTGSASAMAFRRYPGARLAGSGFMLAAVGFAMAFFMRTGLVTTTLTGAAMLLCIPWSRIRLCKEHFLVSQGILMAAGLPILILDAKQQHPVILLADTWILWGLAAFLLLITIAAQSLSVAHPNRKIDVVPLE